MTEQDPAELGGSLLEPRYDAERSPQRKPRLGAVQRKTCCDTAIRRVQRHRDCKKGDVALLIVDGESLLANARQLALPALGTGDGLGGEPCQRYVREIGVHLFGSGSGRTR